MQPWIILLGVGSALLITLMIWWLFKENRTTGWMSLVAGSLVGALGWVTEQTNVSAGNWLYDWSILRVGIVPIEVVLFYFAGGVFLVFASYWLDKRYHGCGMRTLTELTLIFFAIYFFVYKGEGIWGYAFLGIFGLMVSRPEKRTLVVSVGVFAFFVEYVLDYMILIKTLELYSYPNGYPTSVPMVFMFLTMFITGLIYFDKNPYCPSILNGLDEKTCQLRGGEWLDGECFFDK